MKRLMFCFITLSAMAVEPGTECPPGRVLLDAPYVSLVSDSCPVGTIDMGPAESCLGLFIADTCYMYAPVGVSYTDTSGTYEYIEPCAMQ